MKLCKMMQKLPTHPERGMAFTPPPHLTLTHHIKVLSQMYFMTLLTNQPTCLDPPILYTNSVWPHYYIIIITLLHRYNKNMINNNNRTDNINGKIKKTTTLKQTTTKEKVNNINKNIIIKNERKERKK